MARYEFRCTNCHKVIEVEMPMKDYQSELDQECDCVDPDADGRTLTPHVRHIGTFGLGTVPGAGGTPARYGRSRR